MSELIRKIDILMNGVSMGRVASVREIRDEVSQVVAYSEALVDRCIEDTKKIASLSAQLKEREWISVEDLPVERMRDYWVYLKGGEQRARFCSSVGFINILITHWLPLPSPPITEKDNG